MFVSHAGRIPAAASSRTAAAAAVARTVPTVVPQVASRASVFRVVRLVHVATAQRAESSCGFAPGVSELAGEGRRAATVRLNNLRPDCGVSEVRAFYVNCGEIKKVSVHTVRMDDRWNTLASVQFGAPEVAQLARELTRTNPFLIAGGEVTDEESAVAAISSYKDATKKYNAVVYVNKLPSATTASEVGDYFLKFGNVVGVSFARRAEPHRIGVSAFVTFRTTDEARRAVKETKGARFGNQLISTSLHRQAKNISESRSQRIDVATAS